MENSNSDSQKRGPLSQTSERKHMVITEGSVSMSYETKGDDTRNRGKNDDDGPVFYNKVQAFNRDISIVMIALFAQWRYIERAERRAGRGLQGEAVKAARQKERDRLYALSAKELDDLLRAEQNTEDNGISILDALAATGLRSIRYAKEIPGVKRVVANDVDADAALACERNARDNRVDEKLCSARRGDAILHMIESRPTDSKDPKKRRDALYDVIDVDPYGACAPFLDAAVQCVADGGLLCVTSTDMTVLSGNYPETCYARYGSMPTKAKHLHEYALRVVLNALETAANKYSRHVVPVLSLSVDFYVRVFVRVYFRKDEVKRTVLKRALVLQSTGCPSFYLQPVGRTVGRPGADRFNAALVHKSNDHHRGNNKGSPSSGLTTTESPDGLSSSGAAARRRRKRDEADARAANAAAEQSPGDRSAAPDALKEGEEKQQGGDDEAAAAGGGAPVEEKEEVAAAQGSAAADAAADDEKMIESGDAEGEAEAPPGAADEQDDSVDETIAPAFCNETGAAFKVGGPIWAYPLHDRDWVTAALDRLHAGVDPHLSTKERLHGVLTAVSEELHDVPLYYTLPDICSTLHCSSPKMAEMKAALSHAGFRCSQSHRDPDAVKTDAPPRVVWDIMRTWCKKHPVNDKRLSDPNSAIAKILAVEPKLKANFATTAAMRAKQTKARRWAPNPEENWGPKAAARGRKRPRRGF